MRSQHTATKSSFLSGQLEKARVWQQIPSTEKNKGINIKKNPGTSLAVQWLRVCTPNAGDLGSIPGQGTRSHIPQLRPGVAKDTSIYV